MTKEQIIQLWKDNNIKQVNCEFSCGNDSMDETIFSVYTENNNELSTEVETSIVNYFSDAIYNHVEFYENSDGHYIGEAGTVEIVLDEDDEFPEFIYSKFARSTFWENKSIQGYLAISDEEVGLFDIIKSIELNCDSYGDPNIESYTINEIYVNDIEIVLPQERELLDKLHVKLVKRIGEETKDLENDSSVNTIVTYDTDNILELDISFGVYEERESD